MKIKVGDIALLKAGYYGRIIKIVEPVGMKKSWFGQHYNSKLDSMHSITVRFLVPNTIYCKEEESFYEDSFIAFYEYFDANDILKELCSK